MQIPPSPALAPLIRHFLVIENDYSATARLRMFSDGNTGIVFNYKDPLLYQHGELQMLPDCFLYGQMDGFQNILSNGRIGLLIVVLHPFGLSSMLKVQAVELKNKILDLETFYPNETELLLDQLFHTTDVFEKIRIIEKYLTGKLAASKQVNVHALHAVQLIQQHHGNLSVTMLSSTLQISERKLQRTFEEHIGYSPKRYAGITRVHYFLKLLRRNPESLQTPLIYEAGFFDQAHLIREMKNISGITPTQYVSQPNILAANFLQIP